MKKFFSLMVIAVLSVSMIGCGDKPADKKADPAPAAGDKKVDPAAPAADPAKPADPAAQPVSSIC